jgi:hypothetical protein
LNIAPTGSLLFIVTVHVAEPGAVGWQLEDQPPNEEDPDGVAVSVTIVPTE